MDDKFWHALAGDHILKQCTGPLVAADPVLQSTARHFFEIAGGHLLSMAAIQRCESFM